MAVPYNKNNEKKMMFFKLVQIRKKLTTYLFWKFQMGKGKQNQNGHHHNQLIFKKNFLEWDSSYMRLNGRKTKVCLILYK